MALKAFKSIQQAQNTRGDTGGEMEIMMGMMVDQIQQQDEMYERTGVEAEEFEINLAYFLQKDPLVAKKIQEM